METPDQTIPGPRRVLTRNKGASDYYDAGRPPRPSFKSRRTRRDLQTGHVSFHLDQPTLAAVEQAAAREERSKSDWIRLVLRRELRQLGLLSGNRKARGAAEEK